MDYKKAASGDQDEISPKNDFSKTGSDTPGSSEKKSLGEYLASLITWLEAFTGKRLNDVEVKLWTDRLRKYPMWRLNRAGEYTGNLSNDFFRFLDQLQMPLEMYKLLPDPDQSEITRRGTKRVLAYCQAVNSPLLSHDDRVKLELEFAREMKEQFNFNYTPILSKQKEVANV
jgi:hypothetical protein